MGAFGTVKASGAESVELARVGAAAEDAYEQGTVAARWSSLVRHGRRPVDPGRVPGRARRRRRALLLDEATSQLDAVNEAALREVVQEVSRRTTVLVVAHRLSTVRSAGRIAVLEDGRLRAWGDHADLVREDELYAEFAERQLLAA